MDEELNSFFNEYQDNFMEYFETHKSKKLQNRKDFKEISNEIVELNNKYPNVQAYLEDEQIVDLSEKEREIVLKIIDLEDDLVILEIKESFKLLLWIALSKLFIIGSNKFKTIKSPPIKFFWGKD